MTATTPESEELRKGVAALGFWRPVHEARLGELFMQLDTTVTATFLTVQAVLKNNFSYC